jgi:hypothetical protein
MGNRMIWISLPTTLFGLPAHASDSWICTEIIGNKSFVFRYKVDGDTLIHENGKGHSIILENNSDHMISYIVFSQDVVRYHNNHAPITISEPFVSYIIIEKSSGRFTSLDNLTMNVLADTFGTLPAPSLTTGHCKPD